MTDSEDETTTAFYLHGIKFSHPIAGKYYQEAEISVRENLKKHQILIKQRVNCILIF